MSTVVRVPQRGALTARQMTRVLNESVKLCPPVGLGAYSVLKGPSDSLGVFELSLTNVVIGSAIRIEVASTGALVEFRVAGATTETFSIPAYEAGSAGNNLRIKIRKGTAAPKYQPFETQATASVGSQSVFIAQVLDPIA